jgi:LDH2 family malate/lactate/ureidoglycolate dehydrogenase
MQRKVEVARLRNFVLELLEAVGARGFQAESFTDALIWSNLIGRSTHGVWRLPAYMKRLELGLIQCPCQPRIKEKAPAIAHVDGDNGLGQFIGALSMEQAMNRAGRFGVGMSVANHSNHFGTGSYFVNIAAEKGFIGIATSNSMARVAPHGGHTAVFGTNPVAVSVPRHGGAVLFDTATSAMTGSSIMHSGSNGRGLPPGVAIDSHALPVTDPTKLSESVLLPFAGAKGFGLGLVVELLSAVLSHASISTQVRSMFGDFSGPGQNGHFFLAISVSALWDLRSFCDQVESLLELVKQSAEPGAVRIPGEMRLANFSRTLTEGVALDNMTETTLSRAANKHGVSTRGVIH